MSSDRTWMKTIMDSLWFNPVGSHDHAQSYSSVVTLAPPSGANKVMLQASGQNVRYTLDGSTPVAGNHGFLVIADHDPIVIPLGPTTVIKAIEVSATAVMQVQWGE